VSAVDALLEHAPTAEALRATFGGARVEAAEALRTGRSGARVTRITVAGRDYVLRRAAEPMARADVERQLACMALAAERGVAPRVLFSDAASGLSITAHVDGPPAGVFLRDPRALGALAALFRTLHEGPPFPRAFEVATVIGGLRPALVSLAMVEEARAALAPHRVEAPCHHDPNPGNLVHDGERLYLVDWETACAGDPIYDLAAFGVFARAGSPLREGLLAAYLGRAATEVERARAVLSRVLALALYAAVFAQLGAQGREAPDPPEASEPDLASALAAGPAAWEPAWFSRVLAREAAREAAAPAYATALAALR
jgi:hypothetical protein